MNRALMELVRIASKVPMTDADRDEQRISFSYGTAKIENDRITKEMVQEAAERLKAEARAAHE